MSLFGYDFKSKDVAVSLDSFARSRLVGNRFTPAGGYDQGPGQTGQARAKTFLCEALEQIPGATTLGPADTDYVAARSLGKGRCRIYAVTDLSPSATEVGLDRTTQDLTGIPKGTLDKLMLDGQGHVYSQNWDNEQIVYNLSGVPIPNKSWFTASLTDGALLANLHNISFFCKAPSGGIPARNGSDSGSAECSVYWIDTSGVLSDSGDTVTVYNPWSSPVADGAYIRASSSYHNVLIVDAEDCQ